MDNIKNWFMGFSNHEIMFGVVGIVIIIIISCIISFITRTGTATIKTKTSDQSTHNTTITSS